jgi:hypothetical protein
VKHSVLGAFGLRRFGLHLHSRVRLPPGPKGNRGPEGDVKGNGIGLVAGLAVGLVDGSDIGSGVAMGSPMGRAPTGKIVARGAATPVSRGDRFGLRS